MVATYVHVYTCACRSVNEEKQTVETSKFLGMNVGWMNFHAKINVWKNHLWVLKAYPQLYDFLLDCFLIRFTEFYINISPETCASML